WKVSRCVVHRVNGRIGKGLGVKPRRVLGVAIVPEANRVLCWLHHVVSPNPLDKSENSTRELVATFPMHARRKGTLHPLENGSHIFKLFARLDQVHLGQCEDGIPKRKDSPLTLTGAMCSKQLTDAFAQPFLLPVQTARKEIAPQADAAF